ncbi:hypothetical protein [Halalkalibacter okhensis]|uniref:Uncharacterized protein n=1 Tax=Halalkalibacter okhensis TaxID=333138 RepID=A0A0B0IMF8_9BACI|nr:hypothetical protein [Halalkalibacter okhensis]KHF41254.1 hypothetical protein LQ50_05715 [Halalkalibacter okhensis]
MLVFIKDVGRSIELLFFLALGFYLTVSVAEAFYGSFGIEFTGNIWVNWFGISFFLFVIYTVIMGLFLFKHVGFYRKFLELKLYWVLCCVAIYIIVIPFIRGENPF